MGSVSSSSTPQRCKPASVGYSGAAVESDMTAVQEWQRHPILNPFHIESKERCLDDITTYHVMAVP